MGDVFLAVNDNPDKGRVYMEIMHPALFESVDKDAFGNVKGYVVTKEAEDPRGKNKDVTYRLECTRDGDSVVYRTYLNGTPYAWPENVDATGQAVAEWSEPYTLCHSFTYSTTTWVPDGAGQRYSHYSPR
jgi:hypothetical protein